MDRKDLKEIGQVIDEKLQPIDKKLWVIEEKIDSHSKKFEVIEEKLEPHDKRFDVLEEKLDSHSASLMNLEKEIKVYLDALDVERKWRESGLIGTTKVWS